MAGTGADRMTKKELLKVLDRLGLRPSRKRGQNFLIDPNMLDAIVREAGPCKGETVLEIGPGAGILTRRLLESGCAVTAVEIDSRLVGYLRGALAEYADFRIVEADACGVDYSELMGHRGYRCIANLPYSCSSVLLAKLAGLPNPPQELFVMLQKEMADRISSGAGTKKFGSLSVVMGLVYEVKTLRKVSPQVFFPSPEVTSALVHMKLRETQYPVDFREFTGDIAQVGFAHRRKKMLSLLASEFGRSRVKEAYRVLGLAESIRAEHLPVEGYIRLAEILGGYLKEQYSA